MFFSNLFKFIKDLVVVLPSQTRKSWHSLKEEDLTRPTVILISGFGATQRTLGVMRKRLMKDGFQVVVIALDWKNLSDSIRGLYPLAKRLSSTVLWLHKKGTKQPVFLVAHSVGGLVARYYIQVFGGFHYCHCLVTLGTPHRGTWVALLGFASHLLLKARCLLQMLPASSFIQQLNQSLVPDNFNILSITSDSDWLCPSSSTLLPESFMGRPSIQQMRFKHLSHREFLLSKKCYLALSYYLKNQLSNANAPSFSPSTMENHN